MLFKQMNGGMTGGDCRQTLNIETKGAGVLVRIWGSRGSLPAPLRNSDIADKSVAALTAAIDAGITGNGQDAEQFVSSLPFEVRGCYGTNTSCVEITADDGSSLICDCGTGIRDLGMSIESRDVPSDDINILLSHAHWDHIQGFPFFAPAYYPGTNIRIHGLHDDLAGIFRLQQSPPFFPVSFDDLPAQLSFSTLEPETASTIAGFTVTPFALNHPGGSWGYRIEHDGAVVVYATDTTYPGPPDDAARLERFAADADLIIMDAHLTSADAGTSREHWGHSTNHAAVDLAKRSGVRRLCLFHNDPNRSDAELSAILADSILRAGSEPSPPDVVLAYDGAEIRLD
jgi:phosphoribosyl 1,2-cyclic phosphodiesterase